MVGLKKTVVIFVAASISFSTILQAHDSYVGYSGAPGSKGTCPCHGVPGGTIIAEGFPSNYVPGKSYIIKIAHGADTNKIVNYNASVRKGAGDSTANAGTITSGDQTETYDVAPNETNGVHLVNSFFNDSSTFNWQAPSVGTGDVKLYVAGLQVGHDGPKNALIITAKESGTAVKTSEVQRNRPLYIFLSGVNKIVTQLPPGFDPLDGSLKIFDTQGHAIRMNVVSTGNSLIWQGTDKRGDLLTPGTYFFKYIRDKDQFDGRIVVAR